jgi:hypothetical protein
VYLSKDGKHLTPSMTATHATVTRLTAMIEKVVNNVCADCCFLSTALFDDLHTKAINWPGIVRPTRKGMPESFG